eukprot:5153539-Lingulodinium_polyedra.AAC.1
MGGQRAPNGSGQCPPSAGRPRVAPFTRGRALPHLGRFLTRRSGGLAWETFSPSMSETTRSRTPARP